MRHRRRTCAAVISRPPGRRSAGLLRSAGPREAPVTDLCAPADGLPSRPSRTSRAHAGVGVLGALTPGTGRHGRPDVAGRRTSNSGRRTSGRAWDADERRHTPPDRPRDATPFDESDNPDAAARRMRQAAERRSPWQAGPGDRRRRGHRWPDLIWRRVRRRRSAASRTPMLGARPECPWTARQHAPAVAQPGDTNACWPTRQRARLRCRARQRKRRRYRRGPPGRRRRGEEVSPGRSRR